MNVINRITNAIKFGISFYKNPMLMQMEFMALISNIFSLLTEASKENTPLASKIVIYDGAEEKHALTLWCCSGVNASYIDRGTELRKENEELKERLRICEENHVPCVSPSNLDLSKQ